jgi:anti-anti-sigma regulatory factor
MTAMITERPHYLLPAVLDLRNARDVRDALLLSAEGTGRIAIDGSAVARLSTAGVQLLVAFENFLKIQDRKLTIVNPSSHFLHTLKMLGLTNHFASEARETPA